MAVHHLEAHALLARKSFPPAPGSTAASSAPDAAAAGTSETSPSSSSADGSGFTPSNTVSAAAAAASASPSAATFEAAFTAAVTDVSAAGASSRSATAESPPSRAISSSGPSDVSDVAAAASASPSAAAFAAAFTAAVTDVSVADPASAIAGDGVRDESDSRNGSEEPPPLDFPFLALLVSGGHCQLLLCEGVGSYTVFGGTIDDALGEAYDKVKEVAKYDTDGAYEHMVVDLVVIKIWAPTANRRHWPRKINVHMVI